MTDILSHLKTWTSGYLPKLTLACMGLIVILSFLSPHFFTLTNFKDILLGTAVIGIISFGMTMVLISVGVAVVCAIGGHLLAIAGPGWIGFPGMSTNTAGMMAVVAGVLFLAALVGAPRYGLVSRWMHLWSLLRHPHCRRCDQPPLPQQTPMTIPH